MAENQSGDPGRTPGSAEGDRETVEQDLRDKEGLEQRKNPPSEGHDVNEQSSGDRRKETGEVIDKQDNWIQERV